MQLESKIKPRSKPTRTVTVFGQTYVFKEIAGLPGRYVATVTDPAHIEALISSGGYAEFTDKVPTATLKSAPQPTEQELAEQVLERQRQEQAERDAAERSRLEALDKQNAERVEQDRLERERQVQLSQGASTDGTDPTTAVAAPVVGEEQSPPAHDMQTEASEAEIAKAKELLSGQARSINSLLKSAPNEEHTLRVLTLALQIENGQETPRKTVVDGLEQTIKAEIA